MTSQEYSELIPTLTKSIEQLDAVIGQDATELASKRKRRRHLAEVLGDLTGTAPEGGQRNGASTQRVLDSIRKVSATRPGLDGDGLRVAVEQDIKDSGFTLNGIRMSYPAALRKFEQQAPKGANTTS